MNDFRQDKAIYLQMADRLCDEILSGKYGPGERIPSVRELAVYLGVNANTVVRTYEALSLQGIIQTRRGLGSCREMGGMETGQMRCGMPFGRR